MHIGEGILTATPAGQAALLAGTLAAAAGTMIGLRRLDEEQIPKAAVLGAAFFVASAIQVPMGLFVGPPRAQRPDGPGAGLGRVSHRARGPDSSVRVLFHRRPDRAGNQHADHGPARRDLLLPFPRGRLRAIDSRWSLRAGSPPGRWHLILGALLSSAAMVLAGQQFVVLAKGFLAVHIPVALVEGLVTGSVVVLLRQVRPEILRATVLRAHGTRGRRWIDVVGPKSGRPFAVRWC